MNVERSLTRKFSSNFTIFSCWLLYQPFAQSVCNISRIFTFLINLCPLHPNKNTDCTFACNLGKNYQWSATKGKPWLILYILKVALIVFIAFLSFVVCFGWKKYIIFWMKKLDETNFGGISFKDTPLKYPEEKKSADNYVCVLLLWESVLLNVVILKKTRTFFVYWST